MFKVISLVILERQLRNFANRGNTLPLINLINEYPNLNILAFNKHGLSALDYLISKLSHTDKKEALLSILPLIKGLKLTQRTYHNLCKALGDSISLKPFNIKIVERELRNLALRGELDSIRKLVLDYPLIDVDAVNNDLKSALDYAIEKKHLEVVFYLIQISSDICPVKLELINRRLPKLYEKLLTFIPSVNNPISITYLCRDLQYLDYLAKLNFRPDRVFTIGPSQSMDLFSPQAVELMALFPTAHHRFLDSDSTVTTVLSK